jgi:hypothetical protein
MLCYLAASFKEDYESDAELGIRCRAGKDGDRVLWMDLR